MLGLSVLRRVGGAVVIVLVAFLVWYAFVRSEPSRSRASRNAQGAAHAEIGSSASAAAESSEATPWMKPALMFILVFLLVGIIVLVIADSIKTEAARIDEADDAQRRKKKWLELGSHLLHELGMAFLVGAMVVFTFELSLRSYEHEEDRKRHADIERDAFRSLLGYGIDRGVMDEVHAGVFASKLVRDDVAVNYQFRRADDKNRQFLLRTEVNYKITNMSNHDDQEYRLSHNFHTSCPLAVKDDHFTSLVVRYAFDPSMEPLRADQAAIDSCTEFTKRQEPMANGEARTVLVAKPGAGAGGPALFEITKDELGFRHGIRAARPIVIPAGKYVEITYAYEQTKRFEDGASYITLHPSKNFSVHAYLDERLSHLRLVPDTAHRLDPDMVSTPGGQYYAWRIPTALLPGQGFALAWFSTQAPSSTESRKPLD